MEGEDLYGIFFLSLFLLATAKESSYTLLFCFPLLSYLLWLKIMCLIRRPVGLGITPYCFRQVCLFSHCSCHLHGKILKNLLFTSENHIWGGRQGRVMSTEIANSSFTQADPTSHPNPLHPLIKVLSSIHAEDHQK